MENDFCHEWEYLPMIFTSDEVMSENQRLITTRVTKNSLFSAANVSFYFLHAILCPEYNYAKNNHRSFISPLSLRTAFSDLALWRHHSWSVTSREREALILYIRRFFLYAQIGAKAIFTSE